jgi:alkanesulfonate monooxygenase SsuD/methylene tetrahydromethanopterin reductase-like flavin-dependent oxidoreductase (luciferase family)
MPVRYDIFLSICQLRVDGFKPDEKTMYRNFFDQVCLADELEFGTAWVAETHLSTETQKQNKQPVVPFFEGEIGLNTDILQLAHKVFARTKKIHIGSAIRNILCNGGPIAHAEAIRYFLSLHGLDDTEKRRLNIGFASGRFEFSNRPYGIVPRSEVEEAAWPVVKGKILLQATEIFLRFLNGEQFSSQDVAPIFLNERDFRKPEEWEAIASLAGVGSEEMVALPSFYNFEKVGVIPFEAPLKLLDLTIGTHDAITQKKANEYLPVGVFNLSITPPEVIEATHRRMMEEYHPSGGPWQRSMMPRTAMVFLDNDSGKAKEISIKAWENYWKAMEGTIDTAKVQQAVHNALVGNPEEVAAQILAKYHPEDRLMLWFDFNNHDNKNVMQAMSLFMNKVRPIVEKEFKK